MTDEERKSVASAYLHNLDSGKDFFSLFSKDAEVYFPNHEDVIPMIDTLRPLRIAGVVDNSASASTNRGGFVEGGQGPGGGTGGFGGDTPPGWRCRLGFYGYDRVVETNWEQVQDEFASAVPDAA